eukprot:symbB.v1.2.008350.t1/scaffold507.1/size305965/20
MAMVQGIWPVELLQDPARRPRVIDTAKDFVKELLVGNHVEDFVVLPRGTELLDLSFQDSIPEDVRQCLHNCQSAQDFITRVVQRPEMLEKYRADVEYIDSKRQQRDILRKEKLDLGKRIREALRMAEAGEANPALLYVAEMRLKQEAPHPIGGEKVKTICRRDMKDVLGPLAQWTLYWDRYDEGFFAGGRCSGKGLHVDQVLWSNVGRNYQGYKLVAAWPRGEISKQVAMEFYDVLFAPPLQPRELQALCKAAKVVLLRPGDVYMFSGGVAHTVICASQEMCLGVYESFVNLNPYHVDHFLHTADLEGPFFLDSYSMSPRSFKETKDDCLDQLEDAAEHFEKGGLRSVLQQMVPVAEAPATWFQLLSRLLADDEFLRLLQCHFAQAVDLCAGDSYFRRHLIQKVRWASKAYGGLGGEVPLRPGQAEDSSSSYTSDMSDVDEKPG